MHRRYVPLFWRLFVPNATVLAVASLALIVQPPNGRVPVLLAALAVLLAVNVVLMRRAFAPLARLTALTRAVDPLRPGQRVEVPGPVSEVTVLGESFNDMLDRLETERRESARRSLSAQEEERRHLAGELHDQIGQSLTGLALQLNHLAQRLPREFEPEAAQAREATLGIVDEIRALVRRLRPEALDALGLPAALSSLIERFSSQTRVRVERRIERTLPPLHPDAELVIFRVAQESLTNVVRHAHAEHVTVTVRADDDAVVLQVRDDGVGVPEEMGRNGSAGIRFMRERAVTIGAQLRIDRLPEGGTLVELRVPGGSTPSP
jgi:two-component system, NarL family, sensor histidine kinase UhpB